jgi:hypothetical protein
MEIPPFSLKLPRFSPDELLGKTFVRTLDDGKSYRATIVRKIQDLDAENHTNIKFLVELGDGAFDEIMAYGTLCECIEDLEDEDLSSDHKVWTFTDVIGHQGPLRKSHKDWKGSLYNVLLLWEDGSETYEPLDMIIKDDPVTLASYALKHDLLGRPGWKKLKAIAAKLHREQRALGDFSIEVLASKQAKGPVFQFGVQVPRNVKEAYDLDKQNGNTYCQDAMQEEIDSLLAYSTFNDEGHVKMHATYTSTQLCTTVQISTQITSPTQKTLTIK